VRYNHVLYGTRSLSLAGLNARSFIKKSHLYRFARKASHFLRHRNKKLSSRADIERYIQNGGCLRLNIGSQSNRPDGWLNVDIAPRREDVYLDATNMEAIPSESFDAVLCEHMIEHVGCLEGQDVMRSIYRILKPGGVVRIVTPNLNKLARTITDPQNNVEREISVFRQEFENSSIGRKYPGISNVDYINIMFREWGHQYLYTSQNLSEKLKAIGFSTVIETKPNNIINDLFDGAQGHGRLLGYEINDLNAIAFEATK
jgi:predicted SAM-dependent methyltransferase